MTQYCIEHNIEWIYHVASSRTNTMNEWIVKKQQQQKQQGS